MGREGARLPVAQEGEPRRSGHPRKLTSRLAPTCVLPDHPALFASAFLLAYRARALLADRATDVQWSDGARARCSPSLRLLVFARSVAGITSCAVP